MRREAAQAGSLFGAVGASFTSAVAAICCIGPLALTLLGVNGMIFAAGLKPYRFHLLGGSALLLALAFWMIYRPFQVAGGGGGEGAACDTRTTRWTKRILWSSTVIWAASFILQFLADKVTL